MEKIIAQLFWRIPTCLLFPMFRSILIGTGHGNSIVQNIAIVKLIFAYL